MEKTQYIRKNEQMINEMLQKMCLKMIWTPFIMIILHHIGLFEVSTTATYVLTLATLASILMIGNAHKLTKKEEHIKWIILSGTTVSVTAIYGLAYANMILLLMVPVIMSAMYFDKKVILKTLGMVLVGIIFGEVLACKFKVEYIAAFQWIPIHIVFYIFQFGILLTVLIRLGERTSSMLKSSNDLNEEVQGYLEESKSNARIIKEALETVEGRMKETTEIAGGVERAIETISLSSKEIVTTAQNTRGILETVNQAVEQVVRQAESTQETNLELASLTNENKVNMSNFVKEMERIKEKNDYSKICMEELQGRVQLISETLQHITNLADQTELLALNASIEAARSGEMGRGFSIIADEIKKLATESTAYGDKVSALTQQIVEDTIKVSEAIRQSDEVVTKGSEYILETRQSFEYFNKVEEKMAQEMSQIIEVIQGFLQQTHQIEENIQSLLEKNEYNDGSISGIKEAIYDMVVKSEAIYKAVEHIGQQMRQE